MSADDQQNVNLVKKQYLQQIPARHFQWPECLPSIQFDLWNQVFAPGLHKFPPGDRYQYLILRDLINRLEKNEIDERILYRYTELLQDPLPIVPPTTETIITYSTHIGQVYISEQPSLLVSEGTTGLRTWEASLLLTEWALQQEMRGARILELGAGTGLVGITTAKMGAQVTATDGSEVVMTRLSENFKLNKIDGELRMLLWGEEHEILDRKWDFIFAADVTYHDEICASLAETYGLALRRGGIGILAATVRNKETLEVFVRECGNLFP